MISQSMLVGQSFTINLTVMPTGGELDGPPTYTTVKGTLVIKVTPASDGMSATVTAMSAGTDTINVKDTSGGVTIGGDDYIQVTVTSPIIHATGLHVTVTQPA